MAVVKRAVSSDPEVWADLHRIAQAEQLAVSTVVNRALRHQLRHQLRLQRGLAAVHEGEAEHEAFSEEELAEADRILDLTGLASSPPRPTRERRQLRHRNLGRS